MSDQQDIATVTLRQIALAAIADKVNPDGRGECPEFKYIHQQSALVREGYRQWPDAFRGVLRNYSDADSNLVRIASDLTLSPLEILTVALAAAVEDDPMVGRVLAKVQAPVGGSRPSLGLIATVFSPMLEGTESAFAVLLNGMAIRTGLIALVHESTTLPENAVALPLPLCLALHGHQSEWPGVQTEMSESVDLGESIRARAKQYGAALSQGNSQALVIRSGSVSEARAAAEALVSYFGKKPAFINTEKTHGLGLWLSINEFVRVFVANPGPQERNTLPLLPGYSGPVLSIAGHDGAVENVHGSVPSWVVDVPALSERIDLWTSILGSEAHSLASQLGRHHRHSAGRIAQLGRLASYYRALRCARSPSEQPPQKADILEASWVMEGTGIDTMAEPQRSAIPDEALVVTESLRSQLELLSLRCRNRDNLTEGLGIAATVRYHPGVRALLCGPSGTGKTLSAGWLATRLGMPLYRIDLASITSTREYRVFGHGRLI